SALARGHVGCTRRDAGAPRARAPNLFFRSMNFSEKRVLQSPAKEWFFGRGRVGGGSGGRRARWHAARSGQAADRHRGGVLLSLPPALLAGLPVPRAAPRRAGS